MNTQRESGKITAFSIKGDGPQKSYRMMLHGNWYSVFDNRIKDEDTREIMNSLKQGDEVDVDWYDNKGFRNISGLTKVQRNDEPDNGNGKPAPASSRGDSPKTDSRDAMMRLSYCKDLMIAFPELGEADLMTRVDVIKRMAEHLGE